MSACRLGSSVLVGRPPTPPYAGGNADRLWQAGDGHLTSLHSYDTDAGAQLDIGLYGANNYWLRMTPLDHPELAYSENGTLANSGDVSQIKFVYYPAPELDPDWNPVPNEPFYIRSLTIIPEPSALALLGLGGFLFLRRRQ